MHVDEQGEHQLTNFYGIQHNRKVTESDHAMVQLKLDIQFPQGKPERHEFYNFKSKECQIYFKQLSPTQESFPCVLKETTHSKIK